MKNELIITTTNKGYNSLFYNKELNNSAFGYLSLTNNEIGYQNTGIGSLTLTNNEKSINNTAVGFKSLMNSNGKYNTALGALSGLTLKNGEKNVIIGKHADVSSENAKNQIVIGAGAKGYKNNTIVLGNNKIEKILPGRNNQVDLGTKKYQYKNLYIDGNVYKDGSKIGLNFLTDAKTIYDKTFTYISEFKGISPQWKKDKDSTPKTVSIGNLFLGKDTGKNIVPQVNAKFDDNTNPDTQTGETLSGTRNTGIGFEVLQNSLNADKATALGYQALKNNNGDNNTAIGAYSLKENTTGYFNTAIGDDSLTTNTEGRDNTAIGHDSLKKNTTGSYNTAIGADSLDENTTGSNNTAIGADSLEENKTGSNNTAIGFKAGDKITTGNNNVIIGKNADVDSEDAENQIVIGQGALSGMNNTVTLGNGDVTNVFMGQQNQATVNAGGFIMYNSGSSVYSLPTSDGIANQVLQTNGNGTISFATISGGGASSINNLTDGITDSTSVFLGTDSGINNSGPNNTATGINSLQSNTIGGRNTAFGRASLFKNTTGSNNTAFGYQAGDVITTGSNNVIIGYNADPSVAAASNQIVIGQGATGIDNNSVTLGNAAVTHVYMAQDKGATVHAGGFTMYNSGDPVYSLPTSDGSANQVLQTNGNGTISFATISLNDLSDATTNYNQYNIGIGYLSLYNNTSGSRNTAVGYQSLYNNTGANRNTAFGYKSLENNTSGYYNTAVGYYSLNKNTTGTNNTAFGFGAGDLITTGSNNVIIGYNADPSVEAASNQIVIGQGATGQGNNEIALGNASITAIKAQVNSITTYSDKRIKKDINDGDLGLDFINKLRTVKYTKINPAEYPDELLEKRFKGENPEEKPEDDNQIYDGLIAQEVEQALKDLNKTWSGHSINTSDGKQGIQYGALTIPLIKAVQELSKSNSELTERVKELESKNN